MTQTTVYPKHRFYFNVETESNGQQIANELPSYRIACQHIKHYAMETGNAQEVYYIRLYRRKNHRCWLTTCPDTSINTIALVLF